MKKVFIVLLLIAVHWNSIAQIREPAKWRYSADLSAVSVGDEVELKFMVDIDPTWHLYTTDLDPEIGPLPTKFVFKPHPGYSLSGPMEQEGVKTEYDKTWKAEVSYFDRFAEFRQKVKILAEDVVIEGSYEYLVCTTVDGMCIPGDGIFSFGKPAEKIPTIANSLKKDEVAIEHKEESTSNSTLLGFMVMAFLSGLAALLTPCVFPMIPMTVTFFTKGDTSQGKGKFNSILFGLSIMSIYTLLGTLVARINGPEFANWLSTHWVPNLFFFLVFMLFAASFLGMFEIVLPTSWVNKIDKKSDKGGLVGIFFMAFTLVLVSFSCTGPIVGNVLVLSAGGQIIKPIAGMFAFSLAIALPFTLFALFPDFMAKLPKSGGWLNSVKVVLGFLELALGLKFLSVADQVYHWGLLDREVYLALWIVIFTLLGFYLLGKIRLPHDSPLEKLPVSRLLLAILTFSFVIYIIPGMFGAPLKSLAGYLPPMHSQDFNLMAGQGQYYKDKETTLCDKPRYADKLHMPHGLEGYYDYDQALACAKAQNKPLFIDFTGHGCVNCREMEATVWSDPAVLRRLREDYIVVSLYVDEKTTLPEAEWYKSTFNNKLVKTIGKKNADLQITRFNNNAQPYYVLLNTVGEPLTKPMAYDKTVGNFIRFLDRGKTKFNEQRISYN